MSNRPEDFQEFIDSMREGLRLMEPLREHHSGVALLEITIDQAQKALDQRPFEPTWVLAAMYPVKAVWDKLHADYQELRARLGIRE